VDAAKLLARVRTVLARSKRRDALLTATELGLTVGNHVQHILAKLDVHSRVEAVAAAYELGLVAAPSARSRARLSAAAR
jgi:hypothetical protein